MDSHRKAGFVKEQLAGYLGSKKQINNDSTFVSCPFHNERTPSGRVYHSSLSRNPGFFKCYGCGKTASWDEVAPLLNLRGFQWSKPEPVYTKPLLKSETTTEVLDYGDLPAGKVWRGISTDLLINVGCRTITQWGTRLIYMPVIIKEQQRGYIRARIRKEKGKPSYLNSAGKWGEKYGLFPYDYAVRNKPRTVVLVEGPRDALRLLAHDIPAIAILGTNSWSDTKSRLLELSGAERTILCMDGDDAGLRAIDLIKPGLSRLMNVDVFSLAGKDSPYYTRGPELWDPCSMPIEKLSQLKAKL